ncbi:MAG: hypothetical protein AAGF46_09380, partial [Pseudomonadota bacterium]
MEANSAVLRVATGQSGRARPVVVVVPSAEFRLTSGSGVIVANEDGVTGYLLVSGDMTVSDGGRTRSLYRAGFGVSAGGTRISRAKRIDTQDILRDLNRISPGLGTLDTGSVTVFSPEVAQSAGSSGPQQLAAVLQTSDESREECAEGAGGAECEEEEDQSDKLSALLEVLAGTFENLQLVPPVNDGGDSGGGGGGGTSFGSGFGTLRLGEIYDLDAQDVGFSAEGGTSISDSTDFNAPLELQVFGEPIPEAGDPILENAVQAAEGLLSAGTFGADTVENEILTELKENVSDGGFSSIVVSYLELQFDEKGRNALNFLSRARSLGPTSSALISGDTWETTQTGDDRIKGYSDNNRPLRYNVGQAGQVVTYDSANAS